MNLGKILIPILAIIMIAIGCKDQDPKPFKPKVTLQLNHNWNDSVLILNQPYYWEHDFRTDTIIPTALIYHINHLTIHTQDSLKIDADLPYYMVNIAENKVLPSPISFTAPLEGVKYYITSIDFTIGLADSLTNSAGLLNNVFTSPMYSGKLTGYIGLKFEALSPQSPNDSLNYNIMGYKKPFYHSRRVTVIFNKPYYLNRENSLTLSANIFKIFYSAHQVDITTIFKIDLPDADSKMIADNMAKMFRFGSLK